MPKYAKSLQIEAQSCCEESKRAKWAFGRMVAIITSPCSRYGVRIFLGINRDDHVEYSSNELHMLSSMLKTSNSGTLSHVATLDCWIHTSVSGSANSCYGVRTRSTVGRPNQHFSLGRTFGKTNTNASCHLRGHTYLVHLRRTSPIGLMKKVSQRRLDSRRGTLLD